MSESFAPNARTAAARAAPRTSMRVRGCAITQRHSGGAGRGQPGRRRAAGRGREGVARPKAHSRGGGQDWPRPRPARDETSVRSAGYRLDSGWSGSTLLTSSAGNPPPPGDGTRLGHPNSPNAMQVTLTWLDYLILLTYTGFVVGIGFALRKYMKSSSDFLTSGRSIPAWVTGLAFISANLGALELVGMAASGAKYGITTGHFYWVGAIPAMVFLAVFMMPFYYGSKARSVPGVPEAALRRAGARAQLDLLRGDDGVRLRHLDERPGQAAQPAPRLELPRRASGSARRSCWSTCSRAGSPRPSTPRCCSSS